MRWTERIASLLSVLALVTATPGAWGQDGEPIPQDELPAFLGPVPPDHFTWRVDNSIDFVIYRGKANPPLVGTTGFYLGDWPQDLEPSQSTVKSRLGRFPAKWHRSVGPDGSIHQEAIIALGGVLNLKAHVWAKAPNEDQLQKILSVLGQLPTFSSGAIPAYFQSLHDRLAGEQRIRRMIWICWCALVLAGAWLVDRIYRRRRVSAALRLVIFAGMIAASIAASIAATLAAGALLGGIVTDWFIIGRGLLLLAAAGIVLVIALLLAGGLFLARRFRTRTT
ncbi:MAG TPA: hypothetical protein VGW39_02350 [Chthoniobacterales bacterium]|nr:hypothetical protein [Chthoniobacterales bacterium]